MHIRLATEADTGVILHLSRKLAEYENALDGLKLTEDFLHDVFFGDKEILECYLMELDGQAIGMVQIGKNYSWSGQYALSFQDLVVLDEYRGQGYGKAFIDFIIDLAKEQNCCRIDWQVLDWNKPAIELYKKIGGDILSQNVVFRLPQDKF